MTTRTQSIQKRQTLPGNPSRNPPPGRCVTRTKQDSEPRGTSPLSPETEWIQAVRNGDGSAFRKLYDLHVERVFRLCFRMTGEEELARDCTQEAFIQAYHKLDQFRGDSRFSTWIHSIASRTCLNGIRKRKLHRARELELDEGLTVAADGGSRDPEVGLRDQLHAAIDGLPEIYRTVFVMHDMEGWKHEEIAGALDVAVGTSKARLHRARARLRESLSDWAEEMVT